MKEKIVHRNVFTLFCRFFSCFFFNAKNLFRVFIPAPGLILVAVTLFTSISLPYASSAATVRIGVLLSGDVRLGPFSGFKDGLKALGYVEGQDVTYEVRNAANNRSRLASLAAEIVASRPTVAIAGGGIESDALKVASQGTPVPVVFLAVASAMGRGLVASLPQPGGNLTGIETNDTQLTAKRLWFVKKLFPNAKVVLIPNIPSITPSDQALKIAKATAPDLGLNIQELQGKDAEAIRLKTTQLDWEKIDVIYIGLAAPVWQIEKAVFLPISLKYGIPIMGINRGDIGRGAAASYAGNRYAAGFQAARLAHKIINGESPQTVPAETPEKLEFLINQWVVDRLNLKISSRIYKLVDEVINEEINPVEN